jgi:hypothetical protein
MANTPEFSPLEPHLRTLREAGVVPGVAATLQAAVAGRARAVLDGVLKEVPAYTASGNPDVIPELGQHLEAHLDTVCSLLAQKPGTDPDFVRQHAARRAEQKFPLDAVLAAYRCLHRDLVEWVRDAALAAADETAHVRRVVAAVTGLCSEYIGAVSTLVTSEYVAQTRLLAEAEGDKRSALMNTLLGGYDESDRRAAQLLRRAGYLEQRQSFCVAVARSVDPREMENAARAQRMADAIAAVLANAPLRYLVGVRDNLVVAIVSGTRRLSGWTAPQTLVADRVYPLLRQVGPAAVIGLSNDVPSTSHIPRAATEAGLALDFASVANRVMRYADIPFRQMLVTQARDAVQSALPAWLPDFLAANKKSRGALAATLRAYADADMNALRAAKSLGIHANTLYARMQRIRDLIGLDPLSYHALTEMLLSLDCVEVDAAGVH